MRKAGLTALAVLLLSAGPAMAGGTLGIATATETFATELVAMGPWLALAGLVIGFILMTFSYAAALVVGLPLFIGGVGASNAETISSGLGFGAGAGGGDLSGVMQMASALSPLLMA